MKSEWKLNPVLPAQPVPVRFGSIKREEVQLDLRGSIRSPWFN